jgi:hypothetical protein
MDAGYEPVQHVFGNIAYSIGVGGGILGSLTTLARGEIREFSDVFNHTRHAALDRAVGEARRGRVNASPGSIDRGLADRPERKSGWWPAPSSCPESHSRKKDSTVWPVVSALEIMKRWPSS